MTDAQALVYRVRMWPAVVAILFLSFGCATAPAPGTNDVAVPNLPEAKRQVRAYLESGGYERDIATIADQAGAYINSRSARGGKLAIVVDIDETALSNLPFL